MKGKPAKFKNPFDLMQDEEQTIELKPQNTYNPNIPKGKVHNPLPFDPYSSSQGNEYSGSSKQFKSNNNTSSYSNIIKQNKKQQPYTKNKAGFVNPFGSGQIQQQQQVISPQYKGPVAFNPAQSMNDQRKNKSDQYQSNQYQGELNEDGDPPLLQDIGINIQFIKHRFLSTIKLQKPQYQQLQSADLSGPILIAMAFGCLLLLSGKIHFGDIYAMFLFGNTIMYFLINFMNQAQIIPLYNVMSSLGYALLPMLILGFFNIFISLKGTFGILISLSIAVWASVSAGNTMEVYLKSHNNERKVLLVYPLFLFYLCFAMIVIF